MHREMEGRPAPSKRSRVALRLAVLARLRSPTFGGLSTLSSGDIDAELIGIVGVLGFTAVGAVILDRRPGEPVGRICLAIGFMYAVAATFVHVTSSSIARTARCRRPLAGVAVISNLLASLALLLSGPLLVSRFPHRAAAAWQRRAEDLLVAGRRPDRDRRGRSSRTARFRLSSRRVQNPLAVDWIPADSTTHVRPDRSALRSAYMVTAARADRAVPARRLGRSRPDPLVRRRRRVSASACSS